MENFTIHIFGYGETQINSKELSVKVSTDTLTTVTPLVEAIFAKKPADNPAVISPFHAINIFGYNIVYEPVAVTPANVPEASVNNGLNDCATGEVGSLLSTN